VGSSPTTGDLIVWLKEFGWVKLFRTRLKDQLRHYVVHLPNDEPLSSFGVTEFSKLHDQHQHWLIEQYHHAIKQVCHIEHFQVRGNVAKPPVCGDLWLCPIAAITRYGGH